MSELSRVNARTYRIQVAAELSGVKESLIRAWERRYGVLHPQRTPSGYRTYGDGDIEVLKRLKQLTQEGVAIAQAVKLLPGIRRDVREAAGSVFKLPHAAQLGRWREEILLAAEKLDQVRVETVLDEALGSTQPLVFLDELVVPLLREVGERWHAGTLTIAEEHLISQAARQRLISLLANAPRRAKHHVVCACPPEEEHELGLLGAALHFRQAGWRVTFLGARTPVADLARVVKALRPTLVAISIVNPAKADRYLAELAAVFPDRTEVILGGTGIGRNRTLATKAGYRVAEAAKDWERAVRAPPA